MRAELLPVHRRVAAELLRRHGWDADRAESATDGLGPVAIHVTGVPAPVLEALVGWNLKMGLDLLTGDDWVLLAGTAARVGALARPWTIPPALAELATAVGLALPAPPPAAWATARGAIPLDRPVIAGIVNVTPDSFSDGGAHATTDAAVAHALALVEQGATMLDVGGESTRPGATPVPAEEELRRVVPVIEALGRRTAVPLSVDTTKAAVARAALDAGAWAVNDVSGLRFDPAMGATVAAAGAGVVLMHSRGAFPELASYAHAAYPDGVAATVAGELAAAAARADAAGIRAEAVALDPGFGFAKTPEQNIVLLDHLAVVAALGRPLYVGLSRKRFLGELTGRAAAERDAATAAACALAHDRGARLFRVHAPAAVRDALAVAHALGGP
ncbi:MAG TPA: dihydropteroate synthase [Gemmatimonadales bacterium]|nr:dihydropteroate synthase [Gemmatimonadales bacterium]